ncbi:hypothetical protein AAHZ94_10320 [Streptomyces sp. HSW2009]|uniref:hypothetical protein n=1 Tax=Streptomyces sp. HSW2009 TaxID=3142890 RepID=UPI0032ED5A1D
MSKRSSPPARSARSSSALSRSMRTVARSARPRAAATARLRGLRRELPLPCAKTTTPRAPAGSARSPVRVVPSTSTVIVSLVVAMAGSRSSVGSGSLCRTAPCRTWGRGPGTP